MNSFGQRFRIQIFGESHGPGVGIVIDGCKPGIDLNEADFYHDLDRRRGGVRLGTTPRKEDDRPEIISGVFNSKTTGSPLCILFKNTNTQAKDYETVRVQPRPGHADWVAEKKFGGYQDYRGGGHFSGRLSVALVAAGVVAKKHLPSITIESRIVEIGGMTDVDKALQMAVELNDSIGGIVECKILNVPAGIGEPFFNSLESVISHLAFSVPAVKGIEFGNGFAAARLTGSQNNDIFIDAEGHTATNRAGGISGGLSNGNPIVFRVAIKPSSSTPAVQQSYNFETHRMQTLAVKGRHDLCIALRIPVILESIAAIAIADLFGE